MMPGINPRQMQQAMKRLGIKQDDISAKEVIIRLSDREIVLSNPSVQKVNMMGQMSYQITGDESVRSLTSADIMAEISTEDIQTIVDQTGCSEKEAKAALLKTKGDLAAAIMMFSKD